MGNTIKATGATENENATAAETESTQAQAQQQESGKTYTQEEVVKLLQAEADKRVTQALASQKKKFEKELSLAKLDGDERAKAEKDNRIAELEEQVAQYRVEANKSELKSVLSARGLSAEFADIIVISDDLEAAQKNIDTLDKLFKAAVKAEVERRLSGNIPKGNGSTGGVMSKEAFNKLSIAEQDKLYRSNPDFYKQFFN